MSQSMGQNYITKIPSFVDDASIVEAFSLYHFGKDNYDPSEEGATPATNSIEGHFAAVETRIDEVEADIIGLGSTFVEQDTSVGNTITATSSSIVPLSIKGAVSHSVSLQEWKNSSNDVIAKIGIDGTTTLGKYLAVNTITPSTDTSIVANIASAAHKGIIVKGALSQTGNLQEWQNNSATVLASISSAGNISTSGTVSAPRIISTVATGTAPFTVSSTTVVANLNADLLDGLDLHTGRNNEANKIVRTDSNGYLQTGYINSSNGDENNNSNPNRVWGTNGSDSYLRTYTTSALSVGYASSAGNADTLDGNHSSAFALSGHSHGIQGGTFIVSGTFYSFGPGGFNTVIMSSGGQYGWNGYYEGVGFMTIYQNGSNSAYASGTRRINAVWWS